MCFFLRSLFLQLSFSIFCIMPAIADTIVDCNEIANRLLVAAKHPQPAQYRILAFMNSAAFAAIEQLRVDVASASDADIQLAVASSARTILLTMLPTQRQEVLVAFERSFDLKELKDRNRARDIGEMVAKKLLADESRTSVASKSDYRPFCKPGEYVPTTIPVFRDWGNRRTWVLKSASEIRPGPPPLLDSDVWSRDFNETKTFGAQNSNRTFEQTKSALFWQDIATPIHFGLVRSIAIAPERNLVENVRLYAAASQAMDDAFIAVFDAKYAYNFWRPLTAIRNAEIDQNSQTSSEPNWQPLIETPMHPEYPCAHCIVTAALAAVIEEDVGDDYPLSTSSANFPGETRVFKGTESLIQEVANARIFAGVHYRNSNEVGISMGKQIGKIASSNFGLAASKK
jgi:hypothetical protein